MKHFLNYLIVMTLLYIFMVMQNGFDSDTTLSFIVVLVILGGHVYLITRKHAILGIIIPSVIAISIYPAYQIISPKGAEIVVFVALYVITEVQAIWIWRIVRKDMKSE